MRMLYFTQSLITATSGILLSAQCTVIFITCPSAPLVVVIFVDCTVIVLQLMVRCCWYSLLQNFASTVHNSIGHFVDLLIDVLCSFQFVQAAYFLYFRVICEYKNSVILLFNIKSLLQFVCFFVCFVCFVFFTAAGWSTLRFKVCQLLFRLDFMQAYMYIFIRISTRSVQ